MLILLAHYKLIEDDSALRSVSHLFMSFETVLWKHCYSLDEMLQRRTTTEYVTDTVNLDRVQSLLKMIYYRRRFVAHREEAIRQKQMAAQGWAHMHT